MAIIRTYGTYRPKRLSNPLSLGGGVSMNGTYTPAFFLDNQFADYKAAGLTNTLDSEIPENRYTAEIAPWVPKLTRFIIGEYNDTYVIGADYVASMVSVGAEFQITPFATPAEAIIWVKANTSLVEQTPWVFILAPAWVGMMWEVVPEKLLTIA